jgi:hypothetical protein
VNGLDSIEESIDCIVLLIQNIYKDKSISDGLWKLYPQLIAICYGQEGEEDGGFGQEYTSQIVTALKNFISTDPDGMLKVGEGQTKSFLALTMPFI